LADSLHSPQSPVTGAKGPGLKQDVLSRYEQDGEGNIIIDVTAIRVEDLYNDFDKSAPYIRRDLDQDLADYLIGCARELARAPFMVRFTLVNPPDEPRLSRIQRSLNTYFLYLAEIEMQKILQMFRRSAILFIVGLGILFTSVSLNRLLGPERSVTANVFAEGLTVAAWVSLWEALAIFLIEWFPHRKNVLLYRRLAQARLAFRSTAEAESNAGKGSSNNRIHPW
jgi:hypothetical protein